VLSEESSQEKENVQNSSSLTYVLCCIENVSVTDQCKADGNLE